MYPIHAVSHVHKHTSFTPGKSISKYYVGTIREVVKENRRGSTLVRFVNSISIRVCSVCTPRRAPYPVSKVKWRRESGPVERRTGARERSERDRLSRAVFPLRNNPTVNQHFLSNCFLITKIQSNLGQLTPAIIHEHNNIQHQRLSRGTVMGPDWGPFGFVGRCDSIPITHIRSIYETIESSELQLRIHKGRIMTGFCSMLK